MVTLNTTITPITIEYKQNLTEAEENIAFLSIAKIQETIQWSQESRQLSQKLLAEPTNHKLFARDPQTNEILGYAVVVPKEAQIWLISQIAVNAFHHREGIGKALMAQIFQMARTNKVKQVFLCTRGDIERIVQFYQSCANLNKVRPTIEEDGQYKNGDRKLRIKYFI